MRIIQSIFHATQGRLTVIIEAILSMNRMKIWHLCHLSACDDLSMYSRSIINKNHMQSKQSHTQSKRALQSDFAFTMIPELGSNFLRCMVRLFYLCTSNTSEAIILSRKFCRRF